MSSYKIEKNVPMPSQLHTKSPKYPFRDMAIGDSFVVPVGEVKNARSCAYQFCMRNRPKKIVIRKQEDGSYRCWRMPNVESD